MNLNTNKIMDLKKLHEFKAGECNVCIYFGRVLNLFAHNPAQSVFRLFHDEIGLQNTAGFDPRLAILNSTFARSLQFSTKELI